MSADGGGSRLMKSSVASASPLHLWQTEVKQDKQQSRTNSKAVLGCAEEAKEGISCHAKEIVAWCSRSQPACSPLLTLSPFCSTTEWFKSLKEQKSSFWGQVDEISQLCSWSALVRDRVVSCGWR